MATTVDFTEGPISTAGPRWSPSLAEHANWCRAHGSEISPLDFDLGRTKAQSEEHQRQRAGLVCGICNDAVTTAVQQTQAAVDLKCGFTGAEWENYSFAGQMQACFKGKWTWALFVSFPQMSTDNYDRAGKLAVCKQEAAIRAKLPAGNSRYVGSGLEGQVGSAKANRIKEVAADKNCWFCKSTSPLLAAPIPR
jgi:hypothetical protein